VRHADGSTSRAGSVGSAVGGGALEHAPGWAELPVVRSVRSIGLGYRIYIYPVRLSYFLAMEQCFFLSQYFSIS
jgi:hypothetical protein